MKSGGGKGEKNVEGMGLNRALDLKTKRGGKNGEKKKPSAVTTYTKNGSKTKDRQRTGLSGERK